MANNNFNIIAVDGPSGVGKSTISKLLAKSLNYLYIDTGAMFRCLALKWNELGQVDDEATLQQVCSPKIELNPDNITLDGKDVSEAIRTEEISKLASKISQFGVIRANLKALQHAQAENAKLKGAFSGAVLEGRDIGTVVFPNADFKFFLEANAEERARRRTLQLKEKGQQANYETVLKNIKLRDSNDQNREIAPLKPAEDSILVDSSALTIDQVIKIMLDQVNK